MANKIKRIDELRTGMVVKFIGKQEHYVVYKNAVGTASGYTDYLVEVEGENFWSSSLSEYSENELLENIEIGTVWVPTYPYYTGKKLLESLKDSEIIYQKEEVVEMTMEEVRKLLGKNIKIIK